MQNAADCKEKHGVWKGFDPSIHRINLLFAGFQHSVPFIKIGIVFTEASLKRGRLAVSVQMGEIAESAASQISNAFLAFLRCQRGDRGRQSDKSLPQNNR